MVFFAAASDCIENRSATPAQRVNIYMEKERVADFYAALAQGSLRVVKAEDTDRQEE